MAFSDAMKAYLKKQGKTDAEIAALEAAADTSGADAAADTPKKPKVDSTRYPSISSPTQATQLINKVFQDVLKRPATAEEMKKWKPLLKDAQEKNASTQKYTVKGKIGTQATTGGLDADTWLLLQLQGDPEYKAELDKVKFTDPDLFKRQADKKLYEDAIFCGIPILATSRIIFL